MLMLGENNPGKHTKSREKLRQRNITNPPMRNPETRAKMANSRARDWIVTSPQGHVYYIHNLRKFCREHNLHQGHLVMGQWKGWKCIKK